MIFYYCLSFQFNLKGIFNFLAGEHLWWRFYSFQNTYRLLQSLYTLLVFTDLHDCRHGMTCTNNKPLINDELTQEIRLVWDIFKLYCQTISKNKYSLYLLCFTFLYCFMNVIVESYNNKISTTAGLTQYILLLNRQQGVFSHVPY